MKFYAIFKEFHAILLNNGSKFFRKKIQVIYLICFLFNKIESLVSGIC